MTLEPVLALAWNASIGIPLLLVSLIVLGLIWLLGSPKRAQGRRRERVAESSTERRDPIVVDEHDAAVMSATREPNLRQGDFSDDVLASDPFAPARAQVTSKDAVTLNPAAKRSTDVDQGLRAELEKLGATLAGERLTATKPAKGAAPAANQVSTSQFSQPSSQAASIIEALRSPAPLDSPLNAAPLDTPRDAATRLEPAASAPAPREVPHSDLGKRPPQLPVERIVTLFVVSREGQPFNGPDLIVAAEKAGLEFGDMGIYHRLLDGKRELGPVFSVANMLKPGNFDLGRLETLRTPGLSFFMTLPAPIPALDAWDTMLPAAQRLAELLDGFVLDEERNALGRQRIAHIRDELRGWDRGHEGEEIIFGR